MNGRIIQLRFRQAAYQKFLVVLTCALVLLLLPPIAAGDEPPKNVLMLFSDDTSIPANVVVNDAIRSTLKAHSKSSSIQIYDEGQDSFRINNEKYETEFVRLLQRKYEGVRVDLIFAMGAPALEFLLKHRHELFSGIPIVFLVTDQSRLADLKLDSNVTGVSGKAEVRPTLDLALAFHPQTERVIVVGGSTPHDRGLMTLAQNEYRVYEDRVAFTYLSDLTPGELRERLAVSNDKTVIIFLTFTADRTGTTHRSPEVLSLLASSATAPIYAQAETHLGHGTVGGQLLSYEAMGIRAGQIGLRILGGESSQHIAPQTVASVNMFDWRQLRRWNIDESKLPPGSVVRFKEFSVWEQYKWHIVALLSLLISEAALIVYLVINRARRRRAEKESERFARLAEAERKHLDEVVSNTPGIVWESRLDPVSGTRTIEYVNDYVETLLGYSVEECLAKPNFWLSVVLDEDRAGSARAVEATLAQRGDNLHQFRCLTKDGRVLWVEAHLAPILDETGQAVGLRGVAMDISARREAEAALRESEARFRHMADTAPVLIWMADTELVYTFFNQKVLDFTGRTMEELYGEGWLKIVHPDDTQQCIEARTTGHRRKEPFVTEYRLRRADDEYRWVYDTGTPRFAADGDFLGYIGSTVDITDRKSAEEALQLAHEEVSKLKNQLEAENIYLQEEIRLTHNVDEIVGESNAIKYVLFKIEQVAKTDTTVLIMGETGTGKELVARALHSQSGRKDRPLVKVNCAALPASLIESELFGHEKGAFTGATTRKIGRFELADGATIFLDEIGELPLELQPKLLRVIQEGEIERLGSSKTIKVDVRVIAATNRNMKSEVDKGTFREDLWYRLNVFPITLPPLRQRKEDIPLMVEHFANVFSKKVGKTINSISAATMKKFQEHSWPGNVRELANVIERALVIADGSVLNVTEQFEQRKVSIESKTLEEIEKEHITRTLDQTGWRVEGPSGAARLLGLHPSTLRTKMIKLGIHKSIRQLAESSAGQK